MTQNNGKGQHGDMRHDDGNRRQHGDERPRGSRATSSTTMVMGGTTMARGSTVTCGTTTATATGGSTVTARGSRATGGTTTATGNTTRRHDEGNVQQTTTIRYFILMRLAEDLNIYIYIY